MRQLDNIVLVSLSAALVAALAGCSGSEGQAQAATPPPSTHALNPQLIAQGKEIFRFDTFGDERQWTDQLRMHEVVQNLTPVQALGVGLKVDVDAVPPEVLASADLNSAATTVALLKLNAVVGVKATVNDENVITSLGVTCALCHSTVDDSARDGIGHRLDGWPNRDLDPGAIIALSPAVPDAAKEVYNSWGPGMYDPRFNIDGKSTPLVLPPAYGLQHIKNETYTGEAPISYWNAYVAITQMGGVGVFVDPRLGINIQRTPDIVTPKLPALRAYQLSLNTPPPPPNSYDVAAAQRGKPLFAQNCQGCHVGATGTDNNGGKLHAPAETGMDGAYAARTTTKAYRTTPLRGLQHHPPYFHDGSAESLEDVVAHYNDVRQLGLTPAQRADIVEYLKTL
ncbi:c-type cytochrome [Lysobacter sp. A6]|uniref:C-type cytochrome n=1 Tax=Noviluteimonas lactosilytica TaxID=2888523 RepID=A0ABS8JDK0_9GAMM|nr:c-type cytochrome [Lysobacter lactosilyticus]MCC8361686.1 c-type cytochrome [Lysobacter lactosilyticus]